MTYFAKFDRENRAYVLYREGSVEGHRFGSVFHRDTLEWILLPSGIDHGNIDILPISEEAAARIEAGFRAGEEAVEVTP